MHTIPSIIRDIAGNPYSDAPIGTYDPSGWNGESPVFRSMIDIVKPDLVIEVGSWKGQSAITMGKLLRDRGHGHLICVDTWLGGVEAWEQPAISKQMGWRHGHPTIYHQFLTNIVHQGLQDWVTPFPETSRIAAKLLRTWGAVAQVIYLDGSHDYVDVLDDILSYLPLLDINGVMIGDDWTADWSDVQKAVRKTVETWPRLKLEIIDEKWMLKRY